MAEGQLRGVHGSAIWTGHDLAHGNPQGLKGQADVPRHTAAAGGQIPLCLTSVELRGIGVDLVGIRRGVPEEDDIAARPQFADYVASSRLLAGGRILTDSELGTPMAARKKDSTTNALADFALGMNIPLVRGAGLRRRIP